MITLKRLQATTFKGLHAVDLVFPDRGSVLIEGYNEAGKSTLFEAVYVALYGRPLVGEDKQARQEEVIQHGQPRATVELLFQIGQQELRIARIFERGRAQQAILTIQQPGAQGEQITRVRAVDERILKELGNLDGESLRNSCFVEQKELGRIEMLTLAQREQAIQKLLGLERLIRLKEHFKYGREQAQELATAEKRLRLACLQAEIRETAERESSLQERLDAVKVAIQVKRLTELEAQQRAIEEQLQVYHFRIQAARERLDRWESLRGQSSQCERANQNLSTAYRTHDSLLQAKRELDRLENIEKVDLPGAEAYLSEVRKTAEAVALAAQARNRVQAAEEDTREAQRMLDALTQAEAEQKRMEGEFAHAQARVAQRQREAEEEQQRLVQQLATLEARRTQLATALDTVRQWETANARWQATLQNISAMEAKAQEIASLEAEIQQRESAVHGLATEVARAEQHMRIAEDAVRLAAGYEALSNWIRLKEVERSISDYTTRYNELVARQREAETVSAAAHQKTRLPLVIAVTLTVLALLALAGGAAWHPAFIVFALFAIGGIISWIRFFRLRSAIRRRAAQQLAQYRTDRERLEMQRLAAIQVGGDPAAIGQYEQQLQLNGIAVPHSLDGAHTLQEKLQRELSGSQSYHALQEAAMQARTNHARLAEQLRQASNTLAERQDFLHRSREDGNVQGQLPALKEQAAAQERLVAKSGQQAREALPGDISWPTDSNVLQSSYALCVRDLQTAEEAQTQQAQKAATLIQEAEADRERIGRNLQAARQSVDTQRAADPASKLSQARAIWTETQTVYKQQVNLLLPLLQKLRLRTDREVEPELGRAEEKVRAYKQQLANRPTKLEEWKRYQVAFTAALAEISKEVGKLLEGANRLSVSGLPAASAASIDGDASLSQATALATTLERLKQALQAAITALDEPGTRKMLDGILYEQGRLRNEKDSTGNYIRQCQQAIDALLAARHVARPVEYSSTSIVACWPLLEEVSIDEEEQVREELERVSKQLYAARQQEEQLATELHHSGTLLSIEECRRKVEELVEERKICEMATRLIQETHDRIARRVLPITERNMQPLLQQLTSGRYRDVRLTPGEGNGEPGELDYRIRVWDAGAKRYVAKNLFSGGTRDQCSLALRLAFALATLPQELGVAPGFIFLDEPLSAFDARRAQALVELLTTGTIAQQFNQVILISHYHAFDREAFQYHVRMDAGRIVESDLPATMRDEQPTPASA